MARLIGSLIIVVMLLAAYPAEALRVALLCAANEAAIAGYYNRSAGRPDGAVKESTPLEKQTNTSQWRIDPLPFRTQAVVSKYSGSFQQIESPETWNIESDPAGMGWILLPAQRPAGVSPQTITVTGVTLHFVYSTQHVNPLYNRANIWVGQCL